HPNLVSEIGESDDQAGNLVSAGPVDGDPDPQPSVVPGLDFALNRLFCLDQPLKVLKQVLYSNGFEQKGKRLVEASRSRFKHLCETGRVVSHPEIEIQQESRGSG